MNYRHLPEQLRPNADAAISFFRREWGISRFYVEQPIDTAIEYRPTAYAVTSDRHFLCLEVSERPYPVGLDGFVLDCARSCVPARLFVVLSAGLKGSDYDRDLSRARNNGVGLVEVSDANVAIINHPLSLSLIGVRRIERHKFPKKYRLALSQAETTFIGGNPAKGCSNLYDEIEALTRRIVKRVDMNGLWRSIRLGEKRSRLSDKTPWDKVVTTLMDHIDYAKCRPIRRNLLGRVLGVVPHRAETAHKPRTIRALVERDLQLRTRFEEATSLLFDLIQASKPLHV